MGGGNSNGHSTGNGNGSDTSNGNGNGNAKKTAQNIRTPVSKGMPGQQLSNEFARAPPPLNIDIPPAAHATMPPLLLIPVPTIGQDTK